MNITLWIGLGLIAGGAASRILDDTVKESLLDILLGVVGALFAGFLLFEFGTQRPGINLFQIFILILSSIFFIWMRNNIRTR